MRMPITGVGATGSGGASGIGIRTDFRRIYRGFVDLKNSIRNMREPLRESAVDYMTKKVIKKRFTQEGIPKWKKHSPVTVKKYGRHKILVVTGGLKESATGGSGFAIEYNLGGNPNSVLFGSTNPLAQIHDQPRGSSTSVGNTQIPGRPWTQVTQENADKMRDIVIKWTQKKIREAGFRGI